MDTIWPPAMLVLVLGAGWAVFDAWWTRRRWRLDRDRRRQALSARQSAPGDLVPAAPDADAATPTSAEARAAPPPTATKAPAAAAKASSLATPVSAPSTDPRRRPDTDVTRAPEARAGRAGETARHVDAAR